MHIEELKRHKLFGLCTPKEQEFLVAYCRTGGDIEAAVRKAFARVGDRKIWYKARELQSRPIVRQLIMVLDGQYKPSLDEVIQLAWQNAQVFRTEANRQAATELVTDLCRYRDGVDGEPDQRKLAAALQKFEE